MIAAKSLKVFGKGHIASLTCTVELIFADFPIVVTRSVRAPRKIGSQFDKLCGAQGICNTIMT
jgi:hypothetical protein